MAWDTHPRFSEVRHPAEVPSAALRVIAITRARSPGGGHREADQLLRQRHAGALALHHGMQEPIVQIMADDKPAGMAAFGFEVAATGRSDPTQGHGG